MINVALLRVAVEISNRLLFRLSEASWVGCMQENEATPCLLGGRLIRMVLIMT